MLQNFLREKELTEDDVEFLEDNDINELTSNIKVKVALRKLRKMLKTGSGGNCNNNVINTSQSSGNVSMSSTPSSSAPPNDFVSSLGSGNSVLGSTAENRDPPRRIQEWRISPPPRGDRLTLTFQKKDHETLKIGVRTHTKIKKVVEKFCKHFNIYFDNGRCAYKFLHPDGNFLDIDESVEGLDLEDGDVIDAVIRQDGG